MPQLSPIYWGVFPVIMVGLMMLSFSFVGVESDWDFSESGKMEVKMDKKW